MDLSNLNMSGKVRKVSQEPKREQSDLMAYLTNLLNYLDKYVPFVLGNPNITNYKNNYIVNHKLDSIKKNVQDAIGSAKGLQIEGVKSNLNQAIRVLNQLNTNYFHTFSAEQFAQYGEELEESMKRFLDKIQTEEEGYVIEEVKNLSSPDTVLEPSEPYDIEYNI